MDTIQQTTNKEAFFRLLRAAIRPSTVETDRDEYCSECKNREKQAQAGYYNDNSR